MGFPRRCSGSSERRRAREFREFTSRFRIRWFPESPSRLPRSSARHKFSRSRLLENRSFALPPASGSWTSNETSPLRQRGKRCATAEIAALPDDASRISEIRAEQALAGFFYWDSDVLEGFTRPEAQGQAYSTLKLLFPDKVVLYPTRLDPIAWSPDFLDRYFRPEFTDLVTPYFYPVGTTILGEAREADDWRSRLDGLLAALASRVPRGKGLLPVLQGFEQQGYPISSYFLAEQFTSYRRFWPDVPNAAVFAWELSSPDSAPLLEIAGRPDLERGVCNLFRGLSPRSPCRPGPVVPWR